MTRREHLTSLVGLIPLLIFAKLNQRYIEDETLRQLSKRLGISLGVMMSAHHAQSSFIRDQVDFYNFHTNNFNSIVIPDFNMKAIYLGPGRYSFDLLDRAFANLRNAGVELFGYHLLWGAGLAVPVWLRELSEGEIVKRTLEYIETIFIRYGKIVSRWSLCNEYFGTPWNPRNAFWKDTISYKKMVTLLRSARVLAGDAFLLYNDFGFEIPGGTDYSSSRHANIRKFLADCDDGRRVFDGIGFQCHLDAQHFEESRLRRQRLSLFKQNVKRFQDLGYEVVVSELDVRMDHVEMSHEKKLSLQAGIYYEIVEAAILSGVHHINFWGLSDRYANITTQKAENYDAMPLLLDESFSPKPAFHSILSLLQKYNDH